MLEPLPTVVGHPPDHGHSWTMLIAGAIWSLAAVRLIKGKGFSSGGRDYTDADDGDFWMPLIFFLIAGLALFLVGLYRVISSG